jgi:hypothetical protein
MRAWEIHHVKHWYTTVEAETREEAIEKYHDECALDGWDAEQANETLVRPARKQTHRPAPATREEA